MYSLLGAHWYAKGLYTKQTKSGSEIRAGTLYRVKEGDFVYNRLFAWMGSFAVASATNDGCYVSNEFLSYRVDSHHLDPHYLWLYFSQKAIWSEVLGLSAGSTPTSRNRLKEERFLRMRISVLPLTEQRHLVAEVAEVRPLLEELNHVQERSLGSLEAAVAAEEMRIWPSGVLAPAPSLSDVTHFLARGRQSQQGVSGHFLIKTQHVQMGRYIPTDMTLTPEAAMKVPDDAIVRPGDVLIACSAAGCLGRVAFYEDGDHVASTDTHVAIARPSEGVLPEYLFAYLRGAQGQLQLRSRERGDWKRAKVSFRLTELNLADLKQVPVPIPPLDEQRCIVRHLSALYAKIGATRELSALQSTRFAALVPAILRERLGQSTSDRHDILIRSGKPKALPGEWDSEQTPAVEMR
jgi:type I restriction enzyme S subunit